jgi:LacI family transcriptional regulator
VTTTTRGRTGHVRFPTPTMRDVAAHASVSAMTVSRALRDDPGVSPETRKRVLAAAEALRYRRNDVARGLRTGRSSGLLGLVVTNLSNPFYSEMALGVESLAAEHGLRVVIGNTNGEAARELQLVDDLASRRVDGMIVIPAGHDHAHLDPAALHGLPVVFAASPPSGPQVDYVLVDDFGGTRAATASLLAAGHRRIGFLGLQRSLWTGAERLRGFCAACEDAGVPVDDDLLRMVAPEPGAAEAATRELLGRADPPTALFAANNRNTVGAYRAISAAGSGVALAGFDDVPLADLFTSPVTVVTYEPAEIGRQAAQLLLDRVLAPERTPTHPRHVTVATTLKAYRPG